MQVEGTALDPIQSCTRRKAAGLIADRKSCPLFGSLTTFNCVLLGVGVFRERDVLPPLHVGGGPKHVLVS